MKNLRIDYRGYIIIESTKLAGWYMTECETMCGQSVDEVKQDLDDLIKENQKDMKVTVYFKGEFGMAVNKVEGRLKEFGTQKYAQYANAAYVTMVPKRKRIARKFMQTYDPYMVIVAGWDLPNIDDGMKVIKDEPGIQVKQAQYMSFDKRWTKDADDVLDTYLANKGVEVLADYRAAKGFNSYTKPRA